MVQRSEKVQVPYGSKIMTCIEYVQYTDSVKEPGWTSLKQIITWQQKTFDNSMPLNGFVIQLVPIWWANIWPSYCEQPEQLQRTLQLWPNPQTSRASFLPHSLTRFSGAGWSRTINVVLLNSCWNSDLSQLLCICSGKAILTAALINEELLDKAISH